MTENEKRVERDANHIAFGKTFKSSENGVLYFLAVLLVVFGDPSATSASLGLIGILVFSVSFLAAKSNLGYKDLTELDPDDFDRVFTSGPFLSVSNPMSVSKFFILLFLAVFCGSSGMVVFTLIFGSLFYYFIAVYEDDYCNLVLDSKYTEYRKSVPLWFPNQWKSFNVDLISLRKALNNSKKFYMVVLATIVFSLLLD